MKVVLSPRAEKQLRHLPKIDQIAVGQKIRLIKEAKVSGEEKLKGLSKIFRIRVGDYRLIYKKTSQEIYVVLIHHRKDIYRLVKQLFG